MFKPGCPDESFNDKVRSARGCPEACGTLLDDLLKEVIPAKIEEACAKTGADPARVANRVDGAFSVGVGGGKATLLRNFRGKGTKKSSMDLLVYAGTKNPGRVLSTYVWVFIYQVAREMRPVRPPADVYEDAPAETSFTEEDREELDLCMSLLNEEELIAYYYYHAEDWSHEAIAEKLGRSVATVARRLNAAQARIDNFVRSRAG